MYLVGVTGGIGAGKSTVLGHFNSLEARTVDADTLVHQLYASGTRVHRAVLERWGDAVTDARGDIDRVALAQRVFREACELEWLNKLIHPRVHERIRRLAEQSVSPLFCAVPLLYEVGWENEVETVICVWCSPIAQRQRLYERGWTDQHINERLSRQLSMDEKLRRAEYGIINNGSRDVLREQCTSVYQRVTSDLATSGRNAKN